MATDEELCESWQRISRQYRWKSLVALLALALIPILLAEALGASAQLISLPLQQIQLIKSTGALGGLGVGAFVAFRFC